VCKGNDDASSFEICLENGAPTSAVTGNVARLMSVTRRGFHLVAAFKNEEESAAKKYTYIFERD
jgi:hypothetical protein